MKDPAGKIVFILDSFEFCQLSATSSTFFVVYLALKPMVRLCRYIKSVLTQKGLDTFCRKFHIPESVHPQLPSHNQMRHERPVGKIGVYTRFFEYANFRLPLSTFLVDVLMYFQMDLFAFIHVVDPTKVKIVEREHAEEERKLLDSPGGSTDQGDSVAGSGHNAEIEPITDVEDIAAENVTTERPKRQRNKRPAVAGASGSSHPPKKLRGDHETSSGVATGDKSLSVIKELLACSILNVEAGVEAVATLPLITSSVFATPEHKGGDPLILYVAPLPVMTEAVITTSIASAPSIPVPEAAPKITPQ
ncbi:hypothetical protein Tco_1251647, partial [Tanacetum coccineum]